jgi:putative transcriptional regulator
MKKTRVNKQFDKQFGLYVRRKREELGWTQDELASRVGNNKQNISRLEQGEITPTIFWCYKLAATFEKSMKEMVEELNYTLPE